MKAMWILAAASMLAAPSTRAQAADAPVTVVVTVPTPGTFSRDVVEAGIRKSVPDYRRVPGLVRKYFTIGEGTFGGVYLFENRRSAEQWFNDAWHTRVHATYGAAATVVYYDVPVVLDNGPVPAGVLAP
jgi:hypothetical protein